MHDFKGGYLLDSNGIDMFTGEDHSHKNTEAITPSIIQQTIMVCPKFLEIFFPMLTNSPGNGIDMFTGEDHSHKDYFREAMKGNTYVSTPAYDEMTQAVSYVVSAPPTLPLSYAYRSHCIF